MPATIGPQIAAGTALSATQLVLTLTDDVPQSTPELSQALLIHYATWSMTPFGFTESDDGSAPGSGYLGQANQFTPAAGNAFGGVDSAGQNAALGADCYAILRPLVAGNHLTLDFGGVTVDYFRASVFPVSGLIVGNCSIQSSFVDGASSGFTTTGGSHNVVVPSPADIGLYALGVVGVSGVSVIDFNDPGIVVLDSWVGDGPLSDTSFICGYQDLAAGTYDIGGSIDESIPPAGPGIGGFSGTFYQGGGGVSYCQVPGNPCFNQVVPV